MKRFLTGTSVTLAALLGASPAFAGNVAKCEVVALMTVEDESGGSASYRYYFPASDFLRGVYDPEVEITREQDGHPIEGITCARKNLMPDEEDFAVLATGVPMVLSQDFDRSDTDVLTLFFAGDKFQYRYLSETDMADEFRDTLETRLAEFSERDHGLGETSEEYAEPSGSDSVVEDEPAPEIGGMDEISDPSPETVDPADEPKSDADDTLTEPLPVGSIIVVEPEPGASEGVSAVTDLVFDPETGELVAIGSTSD